MQHTGRNQHGDVVALAARSCLMWTREAHAAAELEAAQKGRIET
jgi:hypothetical protein